MDESQKLQIVLQTIGEANRLKIIRFIGNEECTVSQIVEAAGLSQPLVSHHLRAMRENGVLETRRQGPFIYYKLKDIRILDALGLLYEIFGQTEMSGEETIFRRPRWWKNGWF